MDNDAQKPSSAALAAPDYPGPTTSNGSAKPADPGSAAAADKVAAATVSPSGVTAQAGPVAPEGIVDPPPIGADKPAEGATAAPPFTPESAAGKEPKNGESGKDKPKVPETAPLVLTPAPPSAIPAMADPNADKTDEAQRAAGVNATATASAAQVLDPGIATSAAIDDPSQRVTHENVEIKLGPSEAELADAARSRLSPIDDTAGELLGKSLVTETEDAVPHPTLPHVFAAAGRMYNEAVGVLYSLESHVPRLELDGQAEMHAVMQRMQTLIGDFKTGIENIEASLSAAARKAIEQLPSRL